MPGYNIIYIASLSKSVVSHQPCSIRNNVVLQSFQQKTVFAKFMISFMVVIAFTLTYALKDNPMYVHVYTEVQP